MKTIQLGKKLIHNFGKPYIIAEIGANHNGDMDLAKKLIKSAAECGADAVKFQSWNTTSLISKEEYERNTSYNDGDGGKKHFGSLKEMVERYYLRPEQHFELKAYCDSIGVDFASTAFSEEEVDLLKKCDVPFFKVASMDINNFTLLRYLADKGKPIILSTGMARLWEIDRALELLTNLGVHDIALLHCVSLYPPQEKDIHLNNIVMLRQTFGLPVGFSDHTMGFSVTLASVALGACIIEKHFTLDKNLPGWDHEISADPSEFSLICREAPKIVDSLGMFQRIVTAAEEEKKIKFRRSIVVKRDLPAGHILKEQDLTSKRPGNGIPPDQLQFLVGRVLKFDKEADTLIKWDDLV
jgi:N-acetylneuraminate synthase